MLRQDKILVEIIGENRVKKRKCIVEGDKIILKPGKRGRGAAARTATFTKDSILTYKLPFFKVFKQKVMLKEGASKCIDFFGQKDVKVPSWDIDGVEKAAEANAIKAAGSSSQKVQVPITIYLFLMVTIILGLLNLLGGRIRLG